MRNIIGLLLLPILGLTFGPCVRAQHAFTLTLPDVSPASEQPVVETADGGFVLLFSRSIEGHEKEENSDDSTYCGLAKFSADGLVEWSRYITIDMQEIWPVSLVQTADGGFAALGNIPGEEKEESDIAFLHFDAHGYLLSAKRFDFQFNDQITDAIPLENGNVLIAGYTQTKAKDEIDCPVARTILFQTAVDGDLVESKLYPTLKNIWQVNSKLRRLSTGDIALLGSVSDTNRWTAAGLACLLSPDGTMRDAFAIGGGDVIENIKTIVDMVPNPTGGYTLLGNVKELIINGMMLNPLIVAMEGQGDTIWTEGYSTCRSYPDQYISMERLIPSGEDGFSIIGQMGMFDYGEENPEFLIGDLNRTGIIQKMAGISPLPKTETTGPQGFQTYRYVFISTFLPANDGGVVVAGSVSTVAQEMEPPSLEHSDYLVTQHDSFQTLLTRLSPDFSSCTGTSQSIGIRDRIIDLKRKEAEGLPQRVAIKPEQKRDEEQEEEGQEEYGDADDGERPDELQDSTTDEERPTFLIIKGEKTEARPERRDPYIRKLAIAAEKIEMKVYTVIDYRTVDISLEPRFFCQENSLVGTASARNESPDAEATAASLALSPNSIRAGQSVGINFSLPGDERPGISVLTVATGKTVRQLEPNAITWSQATGRGSAHIQTAGLTPGIYLVRVRSGEKQRTAKLEVQ